MHNYPTRSGLRPSVPLTAPVPRWWLCTANAGSSSEASTALTGFGSQGPGHFSEPALTTGNAAVFCLPERSGTLYTAERGVTAGATFWQRSASAQQVTWDGRDGSLCTAGAQHVAHFVPEKCRVLESVMSDSSVIGWTYVCVCALFGDDLMMDVSREGGRCINILLTTVLGADYVHWAVLSGSGLKNKTSCHWLNCISGTTGVRSWLELTDSKAQKRD